MNDDGPELHIARAARMTANGHEAEAKAFLRRLALSCFRHARSLLRPEYRQSRYNQTKGAEVREDGIAYARASRQYRGAVGPSDAALPFWHKVKNPHWPDLDSHGVYVKVHEYHGSKKPGYCVEVQILPGDETRSQCCFNKRIDDLAKAELYARKWVAIGMAAVAAEPKTARAKKPKAQLELRGVR